MAGRPLRPATDRRLGELLPRQLANRARAPLQAGGLSVPPFNNCHHAVPLRYAVLATLSGRYSPLEGRLPTCYSPVRHSTHPPKGTFASDLHVLGTPPALILSQDQTLSQNPGHSSWSFEQSTDRKCRKPRPGKARKPSRPAPPSTLSRRQGHALSSFQTSICASKMEAGPYDLPARVAVCGQRSILPH